jgi:hypothetical protein
MKIARAIPFAETTWSRSRERARGSASSDAPLPGGTGGKCLPLAVALSGLLALSVASAATIPQSQDRTGGATQPATLSPVSFSLSNVTVSVSETRVTGLGRMDEIKTASLARTNSAVSASCCLELLVCGYGDGFDGSRTALTLASGKYEPAAGSIALFNFSSRSPGAHGSRFRFGLGRSHSPDLNGTLAEAAPPQPAQEWDVTPLVPSTAPELTSKRGLRLFNWGF